MRNPNNHKYKVYSLSLDDETIREGKMLVAMLGARSFSGIVRKAIHEEYEKQAELFVKAHSKAKV
jgi:hypothetical protein